MIRLRDNSKEFKGNTLFICFAGGWDQQLKGFAFGRQMHDLQVPHVLVRDDSANFYNADNFVEVVNKLRDIIREFHYNLSWINEEFSDESFLNHNRVVLVGTSMGGYGALKFAPRLNPDKVVVFAPQIKWDKPHAPDISVLWGDKFSCPLDIHICKTSNYPSDAEHAATMLDACRSSKKLTIHDCSIHNVAGYLKDQGELYKILEAEMNCYA